MKISGLEKVTLTDFPGYVSCIIFTQGCNYKCPFCHNSSLIPITKGLLDSKYVLDYINKRKNILEGVVITGGEPTIHQDLKTFIKKIKDLNLKIKLDTNGNNPKVLKELLNENLLDYVAMDIKNTFESYDITSGTKVNIKNVKESIKILKESDIDYEFRTTIVKEFHNIDKILDIIKLIDNSKYFIQNYTENEQVINKNLHSFSKEELEEINKRVSIYPNVKVRGL